MKTPEQFVKFVLKVTIKTPEQRNRRHAGRDEMECSLVLSNFTA